MPPPCGLVPTRGHHRLAIGGELRAVYPAFMAAQYLHFPPAGCIHKRAVLSRLAVATVLPSGETCALRTESSWPRNTCTSRPLAVSHKRAVLSKLAVTTVLPSEENCGAVYPAFMAAQYLHLLVRWPYPTSGQSCPNSRSPPSCHRGRIARCLPGLHGRAIPALPVRWPYPTSAQCCHHSRSPPSCHRGDLRAAYRAFMATQYLHFPSAGRIPQAPSLVPTRGHHRLAIGGELRAVYRAFMAAQYLHFPSAGRIPQARSLVITRSHHRLAIGRELRAAYPAFMAAQYLHFPSAGRIPQARSLVPTRGHHRLPSAENCALLTRSPWPRNTCTSRPLAVSHKRAVLSQLAVTAVLPSGENCALRTGPSWPRNTCTSRPLAVSHKRAVLHHSRSPPSCHRRRIARCVPGLHGRAIPALPVRWPYPTSAQCCPNSRSPPSCHRRRIVRCVPGLHGRAIPALLVRWPYPTSAHLVQTRGHHRLAIGGELSAGYRLFMAAQRIPVTIVGPSKSDMGVSPRDLANAPSDQPHKNSGQDVALQGFQR